MILVLAFLIEQLVVRECPANCGLNMGNIKRLSNVVECPHSHGFNGIVDCLLGANHYYNRVAILAKNNRNQFQPTDSTHIYVTNYQIEIRRIQDCKSALSRLHSCAVVICAE